MAHDLNNINQGIMSALEIIQHDPGFPEELGIRVQAALNQVERSAELIDSVKRFQRIDVEPRTLKKTPVYPELIKAFQAVERTFPLREVILTTNFRKGEHQILADQFLSELFYNLLHNAVKFDRSDRVSVDINAAVTQDKRFLRLQIMDHGPGISDEEKERIFSRLSHPQRGVKGSGMGLTLVSRILERYGGEIAVTDRVQGEHSKGANFILLLPRIG